MPKSASKSAPVRKARIREALLLGLALAAAMLSAVYSKKQAAFERDAAGAIPAQATLRLIEVKELGGTWQALGKFDVFTDEKLGTLTGNLAPAEETSPRKRSREEAEALKQGWQIGQTYSGFWSPHRPLSVTFGKPDPVANAKTVLALQILSGVLFLAAIILNLRKRRA